MGYESMVAYTVYSQLWAVMGYESMVAYTVLNNQQLTSCPLNVTLLQNEQN